MSKANKNTNGAADPSGLRAAGKALAEQEAAAKAKPVQTTWLAGDTHVEHVEMPITVPVSESEARLLDRDAADKLAEAEREQKTLDALMADEVAPLKAKIKDLRSQAAKSAKESAERKREVKQRVKVVFHPNRATKEYLDPETGDAVRISEAMTPAEIERFALAEAPLVPPEGGQEELP